MMAVLWKKRWDFSLPTFISAYKLILWSTGMCVLLQVCVYMAETVSICYYMVPPVEIPVQNQVIWTEPKATNYFIKPPWNRVRKKKNPSSIIDVSSPWAVCDGISLPLIIFWFMKLNCRHLLFPSQLTS